MKKLIKIYEDGKQFLVEGELNMQLNNHGSAEVYEVDMKDEDFRKLMEKPDKVNIDKIKNKHKRGLEKETLLNRK